MRSLSRAKNELPMGPFSNFYSRMKVRLGNVSYTGRLSPKDLCTCGNMLQARDFGGKRSVKVAILHLQILKKI